MVIAGKYWSAVITVCGASIAAAVAVAQQAATEAPTGFDTPTLVENPGSRSVSNGIVEPPGDSFALARISQRGRCIGALDLRKSSC